MDCCFRHVSVDGIAAVAPRRHISIDDEIAFFDNTPKKLERAKKIIGYGTRHVVEEGTTALDLCEAAARNLLREMNASPDAIDTLICVNQSPDHFLPSGSCILHGRLGLPKICATLDISLGCSGYVHGLWLAHSLITSGASRKLLLLAGDTPSLHTDNRNRRVAPLFGDAGTATLLSRAEDERPAYFSLGSDGSGWRHIAMPGGGFRLPPDPDMLRQEYRDAQGNPWKMTQSIVQGMAVFDFTLREVPPNIRNLCATAATDMADIDFFAIHQANKQIVQAVGQALELPPEKMHWQTFSRYGNQSTASVPCVLCDALADSMASADLRILLSAFGVGLSWGSALVTFKHTYNGGIRFFDKPDEIPGKNEMIAFWKTQFSGESPI